MLRGPFLSKNWIGANENYNDSKIIMVGLPYDGTCSFKPGSRFGPEMARLASWNLEDYSPYHGKDIQEASFYDAGELEFPFGNKNEVLQIIYNNTKDVLNDNKSWFGVGGEHLVTLPTVKAYHDKYNDLAVIHFDAHTDLRDEYLGEKLSHATVMRQITEFINPDSLKQIGIRSGTKEEFDFMKAHNTLLKSKSEATDLKKTFGNRPVFLSIDVDVLDPSIMSGTGTPEGGGFSFETLLSWLFALKDLNIVGADVVELAPHYDPTGVSSAITAKLIRETLLLLSK